MTHSFPTRRSSDLDTENVGDGGEDLGLARKLHQAIAGVAADIEALDFNKAVAKIHALANEIEKAQPSATRAEACRTLILLVAPMMPQDRKSTRLNSSH